MWLGGIARRLFLLNADPPTNPATHRECAAEPKSSHPIVDTSAASIEQIRPKTSRSRTAFGTR
jgi:hypothetical protein